MEGAPGSRLFVHGLDDAAGLNDRDALDRLLGAFKAESSTDFVLLCRVADWPSAPAIATIKSWTGVEPVELTIAPLGRAETVAILLSRPTSLKLRRQTSRNITEGAGSASGSEIRRC